MADPVDAWIGALVARHVQPFTSAEFLKAVRALSARYVERRADLPHRAATDSAGKRAAFAAYYAPVHFLVVRAIVEAIGDEKPPRTIVDLGCGTGAASAAWAMAANPTARLVGIDRDRWALDEARWNWEQLGLAGRVMRADLSRGGDATLRAATRDPHDRGILLAWSANEFRADAREALLSALLDEAQAGVSILIVEPLARSAVPWWPAVAARWMSIGARADEWKFDQPLPSALEHIRQAAGFRAQPLSARSIWIRRAAGRVLRSPHGPRSRLG
jgi:protein-L-isoaspartate O-methyltransferase